MAITDFSILTDAKDLIRIAEKDIRLEIRQRTEVLAMVVFAFCAVFVIGLAGIAAGTMGASIGTYPALLWIIFALTGMLGLGSVYPREIEGGSLDRLLSLPVKPQSVFLGKVIYTIVLIGGVGVFTWILGIMILGIPLGGWILPISVILVLATLDLAVSGCVVSSLTVSARRSPLLLPILLFPLVIPSILISVIITVRVFDGNLDILRELSFLFLHFLIVLILSMLLIEKILEE